MPHEEYGIRAGDRVPPLEADLINPLGVAAENIAGATVTFKYRALAGSEWTTLPCTIVNSAAATVRHDWLEGETNTPGVYVGYFYVVYADGKDGSFPNNRLMRFRFRDQ